MHFKITGIHFRFHRLDMIVLKFHISGIRINFYIIQCTFRHDQITCIQVRHDLSVWNPCQMHVARIQCKIHFCIFIHRCWNFHRQCTFFRYISKWKMKMNAMLAAFYINNTIFIINCGFTARLTIINKFRLFYFIRNFQGQLHRVSIYRNIFNRIIHCFSRHYGLCLNLRLPYLQINIVMINRKRNNRPKAQHQHTKYHDQYNRKCRYFLLFIDWLCCCICIC